MHLNCGLMMALVDMCMNHQTDFSVNVSQSEMFHRISVGEKGQRLTSVHPEGNKLSCDHLALMFTAECSMCMLHDALFLMPNNQKRSNIDVSLSHKHVNQQL